MIMTGRPEFAPQIWPLASSSNRQTLIPTLRIAPRFRPGVLGPDLQAKIAELPEETRKDLLGLIAGESGVDGMDLAVELAKADPSPKVQADVVQHLQFRLAERHVAALLSVAHEETWELVASRAYADDIQDAEIAEDCATIRVEALERATEPSERLSLLLQQPADDPDVTRRSQPRLPTRGFGSMTGKAARYISRNSVRPQAVLQGLRQRVEAGLELPYHATRAPAEFGCDR